MSLNFRHQYRRTVWALALVGVFSLPISGVFYVRLVQEKQIAKQLTEVREEIESIDELLNQLLNLETGVRGYAATGDKRFLQPYWEGRRQIPLILAQALAANPNADVLTGLVNKLLKISDSIIALPSDIKLKQQKALMDSARTELQKLEDKSKRRRDYYLSLRRHRGQTDLFLAVIAAIGITLLLLLIYQSATSMKTAFIKAHEALEKEEEAHEQERRLSAAKSNIIQTISHEYRKPLATVRLAAGLLEIEELPEERRRQYLDQIKSGVRRLNSMVEDVLTVFQFEAGAVLVQRKEIKLQEWFEELVKNTGESDRIKLSVYPAQICSDESLLHKIFSNLLDNALKYSVDDVFVRVLQIEESIRFSVKDSGIGIPHSYRLFGQFERGSNVGQIPGTGLGLSITKKAVDLLGGEIEVESWENLGTEIRLVLPKS